MNSLQVSMPLVTCSNGKGGVSKSTTVVNLAVCATEVNYRAAIIDLDPQGTAASWAKRRGARPPIVVPCLPMQLEMRRRELQNEGYQIAFIDTQGAFNELALEAIAACDLALVPASPSILDLEAALPTVRALKEHGKPFAYVVTLAPTGEKRISDAEALLNRLCARAGEPLRHRIDYVDAMARGLGVTEYRPKSAAANEIRTLWRWVADKLNLPERLAYEKA